MTSVRGFPDGRPIRHTVGHTRRQQDCSGFEKQLHLGHDTHARGIAIVTPSHRSVWVSYDRVGKRQLMPHVLYGDVRLDIGKRLRM